VREAIRKRLLVIFGLLLLLGLVAFGARNRIAESIVRSRLSARGFTCAALTLELNATFQQVRIVELSCGSPGVIAQLDLPQPAVIDFEGFRAAQMDFPAVRLVLEAARTRRAEAGSGMLSRLDMRRRIVPLLRALRAPSIQALPPLNIERLVLVRADREILVEGLSLQPTETGQRITIPYVRLDSGLWASAPPEILDATAEIDDEVTFRGNLVAPVGPLRLSWSFVVSAAMTDSELADIHYEFTPNHLEGTVDPSAL